MLTRCLSTLAVAAAASASLAQTDIIVGDISGSTNYVLGGSPKAYALGITLCNLGTTAQGFGVPAPQHGVATQNMYRLRNGQFEQIGQAWAQNLVVPLEAAFCTSCTPVSDGVHLGGGCSSPWSASTMGTQVNFGPKSGVMVTTGDFPAFAGSTGGSAFRRLAVAQADISIGALFFVSSMVVTREDGAAGSGLNNESYRRVNVSFVNSGLPLTMTDTTQRSKPAIQAWKDHGLGANVPDPDVVLVAADVVGDGRFWVGCKVTDLGGGQFHYEYAVQNLNSDRGGGGFAVPLNGAAASNIGFHGVAYNDGEVYANDAWVSSVGSGVSWSSPQTFAENANTNALRWDTLYNFRFDSDSPPAQGSVTLTLFKPGSPTSVLVPVLVPTGVIVNPGCGTADFDGDGDSGTDADIEAFFACLSGNCCATCWHLGADFNNDGDIGTDADIEAFFRVLAGGVC